MGGGRAECGRAEEGEGEGCAAKLISIRFSGPSKPETAGDVAAAGGGDDDMNKKWWRGGRL